MLSGFQYRDEYVFRFQNEGYCSVISSGSVEGVADLIVQREIEVHRALGRSFEWTHFSSDRPTDMLQILAKHGLQIGTKEVICAIDLDSISMPEPNGVVVKRVCDDDALANFKSIGEAVFEKDYSYTANEIKDSIDRGDNINTGFVAYDGEIPVSIGRLWKGESAQVAGLFTGGTLESWRGKGFYRALVWERARYAKELGAKVLTVDAAPTSLAILIRLGFNPVVEAWPCEWHP